MYAFSNFIHLLTTKILFDKFFIKVIWLNNNKDGILID